MGAFYIVRRDERPKETPTVDCLRASFAAQGFGDPVVHTEGTWEIGAYRRLEIADENWWQAPDGGFIACAGALFYRGSFGREALPNLLADLRDGAVARESLWGSFAVVATIDGRVTAFTDCTGTLHLYALRNDAAWSTSFLALAEAAPRLSIDGMGVYDYVFNGAPHGGRTVFDEIRLHDSTRIVDLDRPGEAEPWTPESPTPPERRDFETVADWLTTLVSDRFKDIVEAFGDRIDTALSGGYDSRLVLGLLRRLGAQPRIHVYGRSSDPDVAVAHRIAEGERFALDHTDKSTFPLAEADAYPRIVAQNFRVFDGWQSDGLFDNGADLATRRKRSEGGALMLNGGGGEIFRNFFYLADRPFAARDLVRAFYCAFDPAVCTDRFDARAYVDAFASHILRTLGVNAARLARNDVERAYPFFRCRFWMGRNNSVNNRLGYAITPFADWRIASAATTLPLRYKNAGRLEGRMIALVDPRLAAYPSVYGHAFDCTPSWRHRFSEWSVRIRPPALRALSYRLKRRQAATRPRQLTKPYLARVIDVELPFMRRFFRVDAIKDIDQLNRICSLEYLFERTNPDDPGSTS